VPKLKELFMLYHITEKGEMKFIEVDEIETKGVNLIEWTPELDRQLFRDLEKYVCKTDDLMGMAILCRKYNCSVGTIEERLSEVHRLSLTELDAKWEAFKATRLKDAADRGAFPEERVAQ
jgi:hypothetical protein